MQNPEMTKKTITAAWALNALFRNPRTSHNAPSCGSRKMGMPKWLITTHAASTNRMLEIGSTRPGARADVVDKIDLNGAEGGIRTPTGLLQLAPEASASAVPPLPQWDFQDSLFGCNRVAHEDIFDEFRADPLVAAAKDVGDDGHGAFMAFGRLQHGAEHPFYV